MYNIYYIERVNDAGNTIEEHTQAGNAKERDILVKELKENPDIIEIGYYKEYANGEVGTFKTAYKAS